MPTGQGSNPGICTQNKPRCARWLGLLRRRPRLRCAVPACVLQWSHRSKFGLALMGMGPGSKGFLDRGSYGSFLMQYRGGGSSPTGQVF